MQVLRIIAARGGLHMNKNENSMKSMNGWRKNKQGAYAEKNRARPHNDPGALRLLMCTEGVGGERYFISP